MKKNILLDLSLTKKFVILFTILVFISFFVCAYTTIGLQNEKARSGTINVAGLQRALSQNMTKNALIYMNYDGEKQTQAKEQLNTLVARYDKALSDLKNGNPAENVEAIPQEAVDVVSRLEAAWKPFKENVAALINGDMKAGQYIVDHNMDLFNLADENTKTIEQTSTSNIFTIIMFSFIGGICSVVICSVAYLAIRMKIEKPTIKMTGQVGLLAKGDLNTHIEIVSNDQIGVLGQRLNELRESLRNMVIRLSTSSNEVFSVTKNLNRLYQDVLNGSQEISNSFTEIAQGSSAQAKTIEEINFMMREVSELIDAVTNSNALISDRNQNVQLVVENGSKQMDVLKNSSSVTKSHILLIEKNIHSLTERIDEISSIIDTIHGISNQTNLLALNASIEAARAGDIGKGFAVVATEVRKLAEETALATQDIDEKITGIKSEMEKTVEAVTETGEVSEKQVASFQETERVFQDIQLAVREMTSGISQISTHVDALHNKREGMVSSMLTVSEVADEVAASSLAITQSVKVRDASLTEVANEAKRLEQLTNGNVEALSFFKVK